MMIYVVTAIKRRKKELVTSQQSFLDTKRGEARAREAFRKWASDMKVKVGEKDKFFHKGSWTVFWGLCPINSHPLVSIRD